MTISIQVARGQLALGQHPADVVVEDLRSGAGDGVETGLTRLDQEVLEGQAGAARPVDDLHRGEGVHVHVRDPLLHRGGEVEVRRTGQLGVDPALHADLGGAEVPRLLGTVGYLVEGEGVGNEPPDLHVLRRRRRRWRDRQRVISDDGGQRVRRRDRSPHLQPSTGRPAVAATWAAGRPRSARTPWPMPSGARTTEMHRLAEYLQPGTNAARATTCARPIPGPGSRRTGERVQPRDGHPRRRPAVGLPAWCARTRWMR